MKVRGARLGLTGGVVAAMAAAFVVLAPAVAVAAPVNDQDRTFLHGAHQSNSRLPPSCRR